VTWSPLLTFAPSMPTATSHEPPDPWMCACQLQASLEGARAASALVEFDRSQGPPPASPRRPFRFCHSQSDRRSRTLRARPDELRVEALPPAAARRRSR
jgi:hypothetical protein